jgi:hypothetical protein
VQVEFNQACLAVNAAAQSDGADAGGDDTGAPPIHRGVVITGYAGWAPGQLAGEVRGGMWGWIEPPNIERELFGLAATGQSGSTDENLIAVENLIEVELGGLWQRARDSPHLQMVLPGV